MHAAKQLAENETPTKDGGEINRKFKTTAAAAFRIRSSFILQKNQLRSYSPLRKKLKLIDRFTEENIPQGRLKK